jgi:transcription termination factor NusA
MTAEGWGERKPDTDPVPVRSERELSIRQFEQEERLDDESGTASVFRASVPDEESISRVALKENATGDNSTVEGEEIVDIVDEARNLEQIHDHRHIITLVDSGDAPIGWIALEYMDGGDLAERVGELPARQALWMAYGITDAIAYAHRHDINHYDLKPSNILFRTTGGDSWPVPKVTDWELDGRRSDPTRGKIARSKRHAAPEIIRRGQFDGGQYDTLGAHTDIFQLGIVCYELFTGRHPFLDDDQHRVTLRDFETRPAPPSEVDPELPAALDRVLLPALEREPTDRYETALDLRRGFEWIAGVDTDYQSFRVPTPSSPNRRDADATATAGIRVEWVGSGPDRTLRAFDDSVGTGPDADDFWALLATAQTDDLVAEAEMPSDAVVALARAATSRDGNPELEDVPGVGSTWATRLVQTVGIATIPDLASTTPETLTELEQVSTERAQEWIEAAQTLEARTAEESHPAETDADPDGTEGSTAATRDLTVLDGIGATYAQQLAEGGFDTVGDLAASPIDTVAAIDGISERRAVEWVSRANQHLAAADSFDSHRETALEEWATAPAYELTDIDGIGERTRERLADAGIQSVGELAVAPIDQLCELDRVETNRALTWIADANQLSARSDSETRGGEADSTELAPTAVDGIGPMFADRLRSSGINSVNELAMSSPPRVDDIRGVSRSQAESWISNARALLDEDSVARSIPDVQAIHGIGQTYAQSLTGRGIETVAELAVAEISRVISIHGVSEAEAREWISEARQLFAESRSGELPTALTDIRGIGPHRKQKLEANGIHSPVELVGVRPAEVGAGLSSKRVGDWQEHLLERLDPPTPTDRELTDIRGIGEQRAAESRDAGLTTPAELTAADPERIARETSMSANVVRKLALRVDHDPFD